MKNLNSGRCACGCGRPTNKDRRAKQRLYVRGHNRRESGEGWMEGGYRYVCRDGKKIALHRLVVEEREGRKLSSDELVHHVDHDPLNNDPDNLVILTRAEHQRLHTLGVKKKRWSGEEIQRVHDLRAAGMTLQEISQVIGRPFSTTSRRLYKKRDSHASVSAPSRRRIESRKETKT